MSSTAPGVQGKGTRINPKTVERGDGPIPERRTTSNGTSLTLAAVSSEARAKTLSRTGNKIEAERTVVRRARVLFKVSEQTNLSDGPIVFAPGTSVASTIRRFSSADRR